jgi:hypothetical protein
MRSLLRYVLRSKLRTRNYRASSGTTTLLATTADLQELVRWHLHPDDSEKPMLMEGWRGKILGEPLSGVLEGKRCVRVGRTRSANPLVFEKHTPTL